MKSRLHITLTKFAVIAALLGACSGCAWSIGDKGEACTASRTPTRGQELIDLKKARDDGAISDAEYEKLKQLIMEK